MLDPEPPTPAAPAATVAAIAAPVDDRVPRSATGSDAPGSMKTTTGGTGRSVRCASCDGEGVIPSPPAVVAPGIAPDCAQCDGRGYFRKESAIFGTTYRVNCQACRGRGSSPPGGRRRIPQAQAPAKRSSTSHSCPGKRNSYASVRTRLYSIQSLTSPRVAHVAESRNRDARRSLYLQQSGTSSYFYSDSLRGHEWRNATSSSEMYAPTSGTRPDDRASVVPVRRSAIITGGGNKSKVSSGDRRPPLWFRLGGEAL